MTARRAAGLAVVAVVFAGAWWLASRPSVVQIQPGGSVAAALRSVPDGGVVRLLPGTHAPFDVDRRVTVEGVPGAEVRGPITVTADWVRLRDLVVVGGESGIVVRQAERVVIERVIVRGAILHGIEVAPGSVTVRDCRIEGLLSPYAQGLEVRNSNGLRRTVVQGCQVSSGQEGLVAHVARVEFRDNVVSATSLRAIAVTEMSEGLIEGNEVHEVQGIGLYCGDESHCEIRDNIVRGVTANPAAGRSYLGYGAAAVYHSTMRVEENRFEAIESGEPVHLALYSRLTEKFPLSIWPPGWRGGIPALWVAGASLLGLWLVRRAAGPVARRLDASARAGAPSALASRLTAVLVAGFAVQSFHMVEHWVQVFQVYVADGERRSGVLGSLVDTEWVHFTYNGAALLFLALAAWLLWSGRVEWKASLAVRSFLLAAVAIQSYHMVEHGAKLAQHLARGVNPGPGLFGDNVGLVWFHFGINLAVYAGLAIGLLPVVAGFARQVIQRAWPPEPVAVEAGAV